VIAADTSVVVSAALPWHENHTRSRSALDRARPRLLGPVAIETYSVLTRLPPPLRVPARLAEDYLAQSFEEPMLVLSPIGYRGLVDTAAAEGIVGGAIYDGLVAATAREAGATLLTRDRRAAAVYQLLGVDYRLIV
jgi:predicted nucleic acid-binding protein